MIQIDRDIAVLWAEIEKAGEDRDGWHAKYKLAAAQVVKLRAVLCETEHGSAMWEKMALRIEAEFIEGYAQDVAYIEKAWGQLLRAVAPPADPRTAEEVVRIVEQISAETFVTESLEDMRKKGLTDERVRQGIDNRPSPVRRLDVHP